MKISYIITVYNLEKYIEECLDSVIKNCQYNCEVLVINDGSTDKTGQICDEYAQKYDCMRVIHQKNGGLAHARNVGTVEAQGEWLCFIDGDDYLLDDLTDTVQEYLSDNLDIVFFDNVTGKNGGSFSTISEQTAELFKIYSLYASSRYKTNPHFVNVHVTTQWAKFYRKKFLVDNELWSIESVVLAQDILFNLAVYAKKPRMAYVDKKFYYHRILFDSCCHRYRKNYTEISDVFIENLYDIIDKYYSNDAEMIKYSYNTIFNLLTNNVMLNLCNKSNPLTKPEREKEFLLLLEKPHYRVAIDNCVPSYLNEFQQRLFGFVKRKDFGAIDSLCKRETKRKTFIGKLQNENYQWILRAGVFVKARVRTVKKVVRKVVGR